ncbi:hypothetical protein [Cypionkella sp. TWP1-2-1b2]|uniref:hypothetical protein n=1 Tax=Cypionkella sp. TWP1-2-1b2 TaxID=2804675 RepID=UPI003CEB50A3
MFNKSEIMRRAWAIVKKGSEWQKYRLRRLRYALQDAWGEVKRAAKAATQTTADRIRADLWAFECKDTMRGSDWTRLDTMRAALSEAGARESFAA